MNADNAKPAVTQVGESSFQTEVLCARQPVLAAFVAPWSYPCQILESALAEVAGKCGATAKVVKVNADDAPDLCMWYEIQSVPTLLYFVNRTLRARVVGTISPEAILTKLRAACPASPDANANKEPKHGR